jgi:hypothetical protein
VEQAAKKAVQTVVKKEDDDRGFRPDMDLTIKAKDKEQAVFELMRTFKLPGWDT